MAPRNNARRLDNGPVKTGSPVSTTSMPGSASSSPSTTSTSSPNSQTPRSRLEAKSILAESFVPTKQKLTNVLPVTAVLPTTPLPSNLQMVQDTYFSMVGQPPEEAGDKNGPVHPWNMVPVSSWDPLLALGPRAKVRQRPDFQPQFNSIENIANQDDYIQTFSALLYEEQEATMLLYERYSQYRQQVQAHTKRGKNSRSPPPFEPSAAWKATLPIRGIHDARPALQPGDRVLIRPLYPVVLQQPVNHPVTGYAQSLPVPHRVEIQATVVRTIRGKSTDSVVVTWIPPHQSGLVESSPMTVRFLPSTTPFDRCMAALNWLKSIPSTVACDLLFPSDMPHVPTFSLSSVMDANLASLNAQQTQFVSNVLARTAHPSTDKIRPPMVLTGPAGTGKTRALLMAILKTLQLPPTGNPRRILVCTPSHTACDVVARRLGKNLDRTKLFRLYDTTRPVEMVPVEMLPFTRQGQLGEFILPSVQELLQFQVIVCTCSDAHLLYLSGMTNASLRSRRESLQRYVETTLASSGLELHGGIQGATKPHFTHLFLDEAAQATEPETLIPMSVVVDHSPGVVKVEMALTGDPRQLSPNIFSKWARPVLQKSFLERLLRLPGFAGRGHLLGPPTKDTWRTMDELIEYSFQYQRDDATGHCSNQALSVFLTTSYRGHPSFLHVPSKVFYFDKLRSIHPSDSEDAQWCAVLRKLEAKSTQAYPCLQKQFSWPIHFRGVVGQDISCAVEAFWGANSWSNLEEAQVVVDTVDTLHNNGVSTQSIGVMATFRAQVVLIRRMLRRINLDSVNVGTVEDYQAVERPVIVLSLTRSNETFLQSDADRRAGLFRQPQRTNVALTRAEQLLVVVGNPITMSHDTIWSQWLDFCRESGLWYGEGAPLAREEQYGLILQQPGVNLSAVPQGAQEKAR